jgi:hypothetical protein
MCGIIGFISPKPSSTNAKYLKKLLYLSADRGTSATGIAYLKDDKIIIRKEPVSASRFLADIWPQYEEDINNTMVAVGHTRQPTIGPPEDNNNNHPLDGKRWVLIHNGMVSMMPRIAGYPYKGIVDSEVLLSHIEVHGLNKGLENIGHGTAAIALIDKESPQAIYLWRESQPIFMAYDEATDVIFFASEEEFLEESLTNKLHFFSTFLVREVPENLLIKVTAIPSLSIEQIDYVHPKIPKPVSIFPYTSPIGYMPTSNSSVDLQFNEVTKRWERPKLAEPNITIPYTRPAYDSQVKNGYAFNRLIELGYREDEIKNFSMSRIETILADSIPPDRFGNEDDNANMCDLPNKYYLPPKSNDFKGWLKLSPPNHGHITYDMGLVKLWDKEKRQHYIMMVDDAIDEELIDFDALQEDMDKCELDTTATSADIPRELLNG